MNNLSDILYPMTDEDIEVLWECLGLSVEELEEMKLDQDENQAQTKSIG